MSYRDVEMKVIEWAEARQIIPNSSPQAQARKTSEEVTELVEAATKLRVLKDIANLFPALQDDPLFVEYRACALDEFKDAVGDIEVTLINACALADVDKVECLKGAYEEIKHRRGTLLPSGIFLKEEEK